MSRQTDSKGPSPSAPHQATHRNEALPFCCARTHTHPHTRRRRDTQPPGKIEIRRGHVVERVIRYTPSWTPLPAPCMPHPMKPPNRVRIEELKPELAEAPALLTGWTAAIPPFIPLVKHLGLALFRRAEAGRRFAHPYLSNQVIQVMSKIAAPPAGSPPFDLLEEFHARTCRRRERALAPLPWGPALAPAWPMLVSRVLILAIRKRGKKRRKVPIWCLFYWQSSWG